MISWGITVQMILKSLKCDFLKYAKGFCFSENYSILCSGQRAFICDNDLNLLHTADKLSYVYSAYVSPDEKSLLLVSNENKFYLVDLNDFSVKKHIVRGKYNGDLEGQGCWSFDGKSLYFNVYNRKTSNSALRCYSLINDMSYEDILVEKYWLVSIKPVKELNKYLLIGLDREKAKLSKTDCWNMIWFDGTCFEEYPIENRDVHDDVIQYAEYEAVTNSVILYGLLKTFRCDLQGRVIENVSPISMGKVTASFSDVLSGLKFENEELDVIKSIAESYGVENVSIDDSINTLCLSRDGKKYYIGTKLGLFIINAETKEVLVKEDISYGVQEIEEISENTIAVTTWHGVKIFKVIEQCES